MSPFKSKKQWAWAWATGQSFAKKWAHATKGGYKRLPKSKGKARGKRRG
jgi:hypothetical protein